MTTEVTLNSVPTPEYEQLADGGDFVCAEKPPWSDAALPMQDGDIADEGIPIFDILGLYLPKEKRILIDQKKCGRYAAIIGSVSGMEVEKVVLLHECAHHITHVGFRGGLESKLFETLERPVEEAAQLLCFIYYSRFKADPVVARLFDLFRRMSYRSPREYRDWEQYNNGYWGDDKWEALRLRMWKWCDVFKREDCENVSPGAFNELL